MHFNPAAGLEVHIPPGRGRCSALGADRDATRVELVHPRQADGGRLIRGREMSYDADQSRVNTQGSGNLSRRSVRTTGPANTSTATTRTCASWATTSRHGPEVSVEAARTWNSGASSLVTISSSSPSPQGAWSTVYSAPWRRPATERGSTVVSPLGSSQHSLWSRLWDSMTIHSKDRVACTVTSNASSSSCNTSRSRAVDVPRMCSRTCHGRIA